MERKTTQKTRGEGETLPAPTMAATFISSPFYFMCFLLFLAFSLSRATHPTSSMADGCDMGVLKVCTELLDGCGEIYLDHVVRLCTGKQRLTRNFHRTGRAFTKMTKRGLTSLAVPGHDPPFDITIFVDVSVNPGPVSQTQVRTIICLRRLHNRHYIRR